MVNNVMDGGNWSQKNTENRVEKLLKRPEIQKLFEGYHFDYEKEKHKYLHFEENSEQSWYLDSQGNIQEKNKGGEDEAEGDNEVESDGNENSVNNENLDDDIPEKRFEEDDEAEELVATDHQEEEKDMISESEKLL